MCGGFLCRALNTALIRMEIIKITKLSIAGFNIFFAFVGVGPIGLKPTDRHCCVRRAGKVRRPPIGAGMRAGKATLVAGMRCGQGADGFPPIGAGLTLGAGMRGGQCAEGFLCPTVTPTTLGAGMRCGQGADGFLCWAVTKAIIK